MKKEFYFAYGSNMNPHRMIKRGAFFYRFGFGILHGWEMKINKKTISGTHGYANIVPNEKKNVEGIIYQLKPHALLRLDLYEGYPTHYNKTMLPVLTSDGKILDAVVYIANPEQVVSGLFPTQEYLDHLLIGGKYLSKKYNNYLRNLRN